MELPQLSRVFGPPGYAQNMLASMRGPAADHTLATLLPDPRGAGQLILADSSALEVKPAVRRSRFRGLTWDKKERRWRVRINVMGKQHHVGRYYSEVEAARAFDRAALCIYGELAITNFGLTAARQDPTPVSAHILMVKQEYDRFRKEQQEEQKAAELNAATLSLAAADPTLQQLLQAQQLALGSPRGSCASAPGHLASLPTSGPPSLANSCSAISEPLPDLSALPGTSQALASDLLVLSNMEMASNGTPLVPVSSSAGCFPVKTDWLLGQLANLGVSSGADRPPAARAVTAAPAPRPLAPTFNYPVRQQLPQPQLLGPLAQEVKLGPFRPDDEVQSSSFMAPGWSAAASQQPHQVQVADSASGLLMWAQQGGLVSPHTPLGSLLMQTQAAAVGYNPTSQQAPVVGAAGAMGPGARSGGCRVDQCLDANSMLQVMQDEARLAAMDAMIQEREQQLAQLQQMRLQQHALVLQQYNQ